VLLGGQIMTRSLSGDGALQPDFIKHVDSPSCHGDTSTATAQRGFRVHASQHAAGVITAVALVTLPMSSPSQSIFCIVPHAAAADDDDDEDDDKLGCTAAPPVAPLCRLISVALSTSATNTLVATTNRM
jgi:hypothetical protein